MTPRLKRILLIIAFLLFILGVGMLTWALFFRPLFQQPPEPAANANTNQPGGVLPSTNINRPANANTPGPLATGPGALPTPSEVANGGLTTVTQVTTTPATQATTIAGGRGLAYYNATSGLFEQVNPETGAVLQLSPKRFPSVEHITWSPDHQKAVLEFPDDSRVIYDFAGEKQYTLPQATDDFAFSPNSEKIAYEYRGNGENNQLLVVSDFDGQNAKGIQDLADKAGNVQVAWSPSDEVVALFREGTDAGRQQVILIGQNQENFKSIQTEGRGFRGTWTPDGSKLLYTVYSDATNWNPELYLVNARGERTGQGNTDLGLATFIDKCAFNSIGTTAYCGVPDALERGSGLYPEFADNVKDTFYTVDLTTGLVRPLAQPVSKSLERYTVTNPMLSDDERTLFFTDRGTGRLLKLRLK